MEEILICKTSCGSNRSFDILKGDIICEGVVL